MEALPIINKAYEVYKTIAIIIVHSEKQWRYGVGASLEKDILDFITELIKAKNASKPLKYQHLLEAKL